MNIDQFNNHVIFEKLGQLHQLLELQDTKEKVDIENYTFFYSTYSYIVDRLKLSLPVLINEPELVQLSSEVEAGTAQINAFIGNSNIGHLTNAANNFYSALNRTRNLPFPLSKSDFNFSKSVVSFQQAVKNNYEALDNIFLKLQEELKATQEDLATKQIQISSLEKALSDKQTEIQNVLLNYNAEFEALKMHANSTVETERKKFIENFDADRKAFTDLINADKETYKTGFETQKLSLEKQSSEVIEGLQIQLSEAKKIVNIVGDVGITGNYQIIANQHKSDANLFRWVTLAIMTVMSGLIVWSIIELSDKDFDIYKSLVRIIAAAVLTYPAIYASRESTKHRNLETKNRNLELELASIGPFIELLPEDTKQKIKEVLVSKYFGKSEDQDNAKTEDDSISGIERILKLILPHLKK